MRHLVALRLDRRLQGRIDPSDVIQEACLEASVRLPEYLQEPTLPFYLWLRLLTQQRLLILHRHHLQVQGRDASREVSFVDAPSEVARSWGDIQACARGGGPDDQSRGRPTSRVEASTPFTLASNQRTLAFHLHDAGRLQDALKAQRAALRVLEKLSAEFPAVIDYAQALAHSHSHVGDLLQQLGRFPEAVDAHRRDCAVRERLAAAFPAVPDYRDGLARATIVWDGRWRRRAASTGPWQRDASPSNSRKR